jgi:hypothetical protein
MTARGGRRRGVAGLGDTCPPGYFWEGPWDGQPGQCLVQTQDLETSGTDVGTPYYPGIYGPSVSPVGIGPLNLQPLDPAVRAAIIAAGHTIDCRRECDPMCMGGPFASDQNCCSELCSVDGGPYEHGAYAVNASPGTLLVELGAASPLFPPAGGSGPAVTETPSGTLPPTQLVTTAPTPTVQILNTTRPGQPFRVGDGWRLTVTGQAVAQVSATVTQNGRSLGTTIYGSTDSAGRFVLTGVMDASTVGTWSEVWTVGNRSAAPLGFVVSPAAATVPAPPAGGSQDHPVSQAPPTPPIDATDYIAQINTGYVAQAQEALQASGPLGLPWWAVGLAAAGLVFAVFSGGRR